jgi:DNA mismatch endonuclease (patch repair protein)
MERKRRSPEVVSYNMSQIRSKNTKIEQALEVILKKTGLHFERHYPVTGKPDFAFPDLKIAIFADSCFWHGYNWAVEKEKIHTNKEFWIKKIEGNIKRDREVNQALQRDGWIVMRFWEQEITKKPDEVFSKILQIAETQKVNKPE